jgi:hypothetical protein
MYGTNMDRISNIAEIAYRDLLRMLKDNRVSDIRGTPILRTKGQKRYWYDQYRVGTSVRQKYIGEDSAELNAAIQQRSSLKETEAQRQANRSRLVRLMRTESLLGLDGANASLLRSLANAGLFRLGGTLVGTVAFRLYEAELGVKITVDELLNTNDIDIASFTRLSLALDDEASQTLTSVFSEFKFDAVPSLDREHVWKWRQTRSDLLVEFLTPSFSEDEGLQRLPALGVSAQSLHHLNFLIANPIHAAIPYRNGVLLQIPSPERFAIHKLIVADRRRDGPDGFKARKDRDQARFLVKVLAEDRPDELAEAYTDALSRGPKWQARLEASLKRLPDVAERLRQ